MKIKTTKKDDHVFVKNINSILDCLVAESSAEIIAIVQLDNWFDHKWLEFSGKVHGALGVWKSRLTLPPFNHSRVITQTVLRKSPGTIYKEINAPPIHIDQPSSDNLKTPFSKSTDYGLIVWWSSNTVSNARGSLMVYEKKKDGMFTWYASFINTGNWCINKTKGISVESVKKLMEGVEPGITH